MAGMARRGAHSARHRAGGSRSDAGGTDAQPPQAFRPGGQLPGHLLPDGFAPDGSVPAGLMPGAAVPGGLMPEAAVPDALAPDALVPDALVPEALVPDALVPDALVPEALVPEALVPGGWATEGLAPMSAVSFAGQHPPRGVERGAGTPSPRKKDGRSRVGVVRVIALISALGVVVVAGLTGAVQSRPLVTETVKNFLEAWQSGDYAGAAALTTGSPATVAASLSSAYSQLGAEDLVLSMGSVSVQGNSAHAYFNASIDLGRGGRPWVYRGSLKLRKIGSTWLVVWSPSVIAPGLGWNERLAVLTTLPLRAPLLDSAGIPLIPRTTAIEVGVRPADVTNAILTARELASATGLAASDADQMRGEILAAPPHSFLELLRLSPSQWARLQPALRKVPHLADRRVSIRLFASTVPQISGRVGTETARILVADGDPYLPGTTVGLSGLQEAFQSDLVGTPTTEIVVQNAAGRMVRVLKQWKGRSAAPVRTTIASGIQQAARQAVDGAAVPAAVVAVRAGGGQILAVAGHSVRGMPAVSPLRGSYEPGQAFTIVSTAALLAARPDFGPSSPEHCYHGFRVNGQTFANVPATPRLGKPPLFSKDFANACSTAFAALSLNLTPDELTRAAAEFGIGSRWQLPIPAFTGGMSRPSSSNSRALPADMIGAGSVRVSPLDMALAAAAADSGSWHQPSLVARLPEPRVASQGRPSARVLGELRVLMADTVRFGAAKAARVRGTPLCGQVGTAPLAAHPKMKAVWFVGFRGDVAFAVLVLSPDSVYAPVVQVAHRFAAALPRGF